MHHNLCFGIYFLHSLIASQLVSSIILGALGSTTRHGGRFICPRRTVDRTRILSPKHTIASLIAYLYPLHIYALCLQGIQNILGMSRYSLLHLLEAIVLPSRRNSLTIWIRPNIRVMEVNHNAHTQVLCPLSLGNDVLLSAPSAIRVHPNTESYRVNTIVFQQRKTFLFLAISIIKLLIVTLHLGKPRHICTLGERDVLGCVIRFRIVVSTRIITRRVIVTITSTTWNRSTTITTAATTCCPEGKQECRCQKNYFS